MGSGGAPDDELRQLRADVEALAARVDALPAADVAGSVSLPVVTVTESVYPTTGAAGRVFAVQALEVSGAESEGTVATATTRAGVFHAANLLAGLPPAGTQLVAHAVAANAWVFQYA